MHAGSGGFLYADFSVLALVVSGNASLSNNTAATGDGCVPCYPVPCYSHT